MPGHGLPYHKMAPKQNSNDGYIQLGKRSGRKNTTPAGNVPVGESGPTKEHTSPGSKSTASSISSPPLKKVTFESSGTDVDMNTVQQDAAAQAATAVAAAKAAAASTAQPAAHDAQQQLETQGYRIPRKNLNFGGSGTSASDDGSCASTTEELRQRMQEHRVNDEDTVPSNWEDAADEEMQGAAHDKDLAEDDEATEVQANVSRSAFDLPEDHPGKMRAEWCRDNYTLIKLSNQENRVIFSQPDFRSAIGQYYKLETGESMPGRVMVESERATGPYNVTLRAEVASELKAAGEIDVVKVFNVKETDGEDLECTFSVSQLTLDGFRIERTDDAAAEIRRKEAAERIRAQYRERKEAEKRNTLRLYLEFGGPHLLAPEQLRLQVERWMQSALETALGQAQVVSININKPRDDYDELTSTTIFYVVCRDLRSVNPSVFQKFKYVQASLDGKLYPPVRTRMHPTHRALFGFPTCCYRVTCGGPKASNCEVRREALSLYRRSHRRPLFDGPPEHFLEKQRRMEKRRSDSEAAFAKARRLMEEKKPCKKFARGLCSRTAEQCNFLHVVPTAEAGSSSAP